MNSKRHDTGVKQPETEAADAASASAQGPSKQERRAEKAQRRQLAKLEKRVAEAIEAEQRRIRQLDKARAKRQRLEEELERGQTEAVVSTGLADPSATAGSNGVDGTAASDTSTAETSDGAQLAYCLREHRKVEMRSPVPVVFANGRSALAATCPSCGAAIYKILGRSSESVTPAE